jgi:hypothetical protein
VILNGSLASIRQRYQLVVQAEQRHAQMRYLSVDLPAHYAFNAEGSCAARVKLP